MKKYIEQVKQRSHIEKKNFAFMASLALTGVIATMWLLAVLINPTDYFETNTNSEAQNLANAGSLFDVFSQGFESLK